MAVTISSISEPFSRLPRLRFLTLRGPGRYQQIGKTVDLIRKVSKNYFVVREKDKTGDGYHYHAIYSLDTTRELSFKKGIHMYVKDITSSTLPVLDSYLSKKAIDEHFYGDEAPIDDDEHERYLVQNAMDTYANNQKQKRIASKKHWRVTSVVTYLFKDMPVNPVMFQDFALKITKTK